MRERGILLERTEGHHRITQKTDSAFLHQLQNSLLLALKDRELLNEMQYRQAQEALDRQFSRERHGL